MFKDKYGNTFGLGDFILYTRNNSHTMTLAEIAGIKKDWGYLCDDDYSWGGIHNKLNLVKGEHRIIKISDPNLIKTLKSSSYYKEDMNNINNLYEKLNK